MFTSQIIVTLENNNEVLLPKDFRIVPYVISSSSYIPAYTVEGEEYGGNYDYDFDIIYDDEEEKIFEYLNEHYGIYDYSVKFKIEDNLNEFSLSLDYFGGQQEFEVFIDMLIDKHNLSDSSIDIILHNKDFLDEYIKRKDSYYNFIKSSISKEDLKDSIIIIDLTKTDNKYISI